mgnify:FL=1
MCLRHLRYFQMKRIFSLLLAAVIGSVAVCASDDREVIERPVVSAYTLEAGTAHIAQTYLSPLRYSGPMLALSYERMQAMRFDPERWVMRLSGRLDGARTRNNPARNALMWNLNLNLGWSMMRRWNMGPWSLYGGGYTSVEGGLLYVPRNSNNPVAAKAAWNVGITASAVYHTSLFGKKLTLRYLGELPLTGVFFSPEYGELYYEIYLGNHKGIVRGAWPGNYFKLNNLVSADIALGRTILRLGYRCNIASTKTNNIVCRHIEHSAVVGVASEWISLSPTRKPDPDARYISAMY